MMRIIRSAAVLLSSIEDERIWSTTPTSKFFCYGTSAFYFCDGDAMKHLQPVLAIMAPPYPY